MAKCERNFTKVKTQKEKTIRRTFYTIVVRKRRKNSANLETLKMLEQG